MQTLHVWNRVQELVKGNFRSSPSDRVTCSYAAPQPFHPKTETKYALLKFPLILVRAKCAWLAGLTQQENKQLFSFDGRRDGQSLGKHHVEMTCCRKHSNCNKFFKFVHRNVPTFPSSSLLSSGQHKKRIKFSVKLFGHFYPHRKFTSAILIFNSQTPLRTIARATCSAAFIDRRWHHHLQNFPLKLKLDSRCPESAVSFWFNTALHFPFECSYKTLNIVQLFPMTQLNEQKSTSIAFQWVQAPPLEVDLRCRLCLANKRAEHVCDKLGNCQ